MHPSIYTCQCPEAPRICRRAFENRSVYLRTPVPAFARRASSLARSISTRLANNVSAREYGHDLRRCTAGRWLAVTSALYSGRQQAFNFTHSGVEAFQKVQPPHRPVPVRPVVSMKDTLLLTSYPDTGETNLSFFRFNTTGSKSKTKFHQDLEKINILANKVKRSAERRKNKQIVSIKTNHEFDR